MKGFDSSSVSAIVTDPPYGLGFMGKKWDAGLPHDLIWKEALRVVKPGGFLLAFGGTRTHHRLTCAIEDAGWEIRDCIMWLYGSGFPKSLNVSKAIDKQRTEDTLPTIKIAEFLLKHKDKNETLSEFRKRLNIEVIGAHNAGGSAQEWTTTAKDGKKDGRCPSWEQWLKLKTILGLSDELDDEVRRLNQRKGSWGDAARQRGTTPATGGWHKGTGNCHNKFTGSQLNDIPTLPIAKQFEGYGTALKPAYEPILFCQKPYEITHLFAIILLDLTNEVYQCQKSNYNVNDAEESLSDILVLLDRVQGSIVQDSAKTYAWGKLTDANTAKKTAMCLVHELPAKIKREKEYFALLNARDNGNQTTTEVQKILRGEADAIYASIRDIVMFATTETTELNIVSLWKNILIGIYQGMSKFTTKMVTNLIIELKILKSYLHPITSEDTGSLSSNYEPIIVAMKPIEGTFANNAEVWGQAGINIDGCRIIGSWKSVAPNKGGRSAGIMGSKTMHPGGKCHDKGRWPANIILDEESGQLLDQQTGFNPSRFFYCAKASKRERGETNNHPTVKPLSLMKYLITLVAPPEGALILDPFCGSGSTLVAAKKLGIEALGIEKEAEYCEIAKARVNAAKKEVKELDLFDQNKGEIR